MKILLVASPTENRPETTIGIEGKLRRCSAAPPLGLCYLASMLRQEFEVKLIDMYFFTNKEIEETIKNENPDVVGVSCYTDYRDNTFTVTEICKKINKNIITIAGGPHTIMWKQMLENYPTIDFIVMGEGEYTILELMRALKVGKKDFNNIKGIAYINSGEVIRTEPRPLIENLDELPFPARDLLTLEYKGEDIEYFDESPKNYLNGKKISELKRGTILTSRGCPWNCHFCSTTIYWGNKWRARGAKNVVDEIEEMNKRFGIEYISVLDDNFLTDENRVRDICNEILKRGIQIRWACASRANLKDIETLKLMKRAGCLSVLFGIESGSPKIRENLGKRLNHEDIIRSFELVHKAGLDSGVSLMVGSPGETDETIQETIDLLKKVKPGMMGITFTHFLTGTKLYEDAKKEGRFTDDYWLDRKKDAPYYNTNIGQLNKWRQKINRSFYLRVFGVKRIINYVIKNPFKILTTIKYMQKRMSD